MKENLLRDFLTSTGKYSPAQITRAILELTKRAANPGENLTEANKDVYNLLRYGFQKEISTEKDSAKFATVHYIDWQNPRENNFYVSQEVNVSTENSKRRPDIILYVNGIAFVVIELKSSTVSVFDGVRQLETYQEKTRWEIFSRQFSFSSRELKARGRGTGSSGRKKNFSWSGARTKKFLTLSRKKFAPALRVSQRI